MKTAPALDSNLVRRLFEERVPRSQDTVERCTAEAAARTKRIARITVIGLIGFFLLSMGVIAQDELAKRGGADMAGVVTVGIVMLCIGCLLPFFVVRRIILRDVKVLERLARNGIAFHATETAAVGRVNPARMTRVFWEEDGKKASADIGRFDFRMTQSRDVCILACARDRYVVGVFGINEVCVGKRRVVLWGK